MLVCLACAWACAQDARKWPVELTIGQFIIHSDFPIDRQSKLLSELDSVRRDVRDLLELPAQESLIHIVLFRTQSEYQRYMRAYFPAIPERRAIFIQDRGPGMLFTYRHSNVASDLRHEVAHALLNTAEHPLPLWLDEGLAEYFECARESRWKGSPYLADILNLSHHRRIRPLENLAAVAKFDEFTADHYRDSWAWVHFFLHRNQQTREALVQVLHQHSRGERPASLDSFLQNQFASIEGELAAHFSSLSSVELSATAVTRGNN